MDDGCGALAAWTVDFVIPPCIGGQNLLSGKKAEITSRVAANFVGWQKDHALFDRELENVIRALRTGTGDRRNHRRQNSESRGRYMVSPLRRTHILV